MQEILAAEPDNKSGRWLGFARAVIGDCKQQGRGANAELREIFQFVCFDALAGNKSSIRSAKVDQSGGRALYFDNTMFSRNLRIVKDDIRTRPAQDVSSFAQPKNLSSRGTFDDSKCHGLIRGKVWDLRGRLDSELGIALPA